MKAVPGCLDTPFQAMRTLIRIALLHDSGPFYALRSGQRLQLAGAVVPAGAIGSPQWTGMAILPIKAMVEP